MELLVKEATEGYVVISKGININCRKDGRMLLMLLVY